MKKFNTIKNEWLKIFNQDSNLPGYRRISDGEISTTHYQSILRQIFHHARENPQIQAMATVYFRGEQRNSIKNFLRHAYSEVGHDKLALRDLESMGVDTSKIPNERPLPATTALLSYAFYQIQFLNPVGYLGYLFHLEFMPTEKGHQYMKALSQAGVSQDAMTFVRDHTIIDKVHNKYMEDYVEQLVQTDDDMESVIYAAKVTSGLYEKMLSEAIAQADLEDHLILSQPMKYHVNTEPARKIIIN